MRIVTLGILLSLIVSSKWADAQSTECKEKASKTKGVWFREKDVGVSSRENATVHKYPKQITALVDSIGKIFSKAYPNPVGSKVGWNRVYQPVDSLTMPDPTLAPYLYSAPFQPYICRDNKVIVYDNANMWLYVSVNDYYKSGFVALKELNQDLHERVFVLPPQRGSLDGFPVFEPEPKGGSYDPTRVYYSVLVHYKDKLPYQAITLRELLDLSLKMIDVNEKKAKGEMANMKSAGIKVDEAAFLSRFNKSRQKIKDLGKRYEKDLAKPAAISKPYWYAGTLDNLDVTEDVFTTSDKGYQLVRANPEYVDKSRDKWKPQFMWVSWWVSYETFYPENSVAFDKMMRDHFDFKQLAALLAR